MALDWKQTTEHTRITTLHTTLTPSNIDQQLPTLIRIITLLTTLTTRHNSYRKHLSNSTHIDHAYRTLNTHNSVTFINIHQHQPKDLHNILNCGTVKQSSRLIQSQVNSTSNTSTQPHFYKHIRKSIHNNPSHAISIAINSSLRQSTNISQPQRAVIKRNQTRWQQHARLIDWSGVALFVRWAARSTNCSADRAVDRSIGRPLGLLVARSGARSVDRSLGRSRSLSSASAR